VPTLLSIAIVVATRLAQMSASDPPVRAHLEISGCATFDTVSGKVGERSRRIVFVAAEPDIPTLRGAIDRAAAGAPAKEVLIAALTVVQPTGRRSYRSVSAPTCEVAADALAFLITMTLDPSAVAAGSAQESSAATPVAPRADVPPPETAAPPPPAPPVAFAAVDAPQGTTSTISGAVGVLAAGIIGPAPGVMPDAGVYGILALDRSSPLSPALRLSISHAWRGAIGGPADTASFSLDTFGLDLCVVRLRVSFLAARTCGWVRIGRLAASGSQTYDPQRHERFDASIGGAALVTATLPARLELGAFLHGGWALTRHEFVFAFDPEVVYRTPTSSLTAGLVFGRRFP